MHSHDVLQAQFGQPWSRSGNSRMKYEYGTPALVVKVKSCTPSSPAGDPAQLSLDFNMCLHSHGPMCKARCMTGQM